MAILPAERKYCPRCHTKGYVRRPNSLQNTMALLLSSLVLYIPANVLPVMITNTLGSRLDSTIMSGVIFYGVMVRIRSPLLFLLLALWYLA